MPKTSFKDLLKLDRTILGTFLQIPAPEMAEIVGFVGFDCAIIDAEHGMMGTDASISMVRGCDAADLACIYRVAGLDPHRIGQALDFGSSAVMVPNIKTKQDASRVVRAAKYHPLGERGVCPFTRAARYNAVDEDPNYYERANAETAIVLQIEASEGIANLDEILEVPCLDCIFIGPFDLSQSLGIPGKVTDARVLSAIKDIVRRSRAKEVAVGNFPVTIEQAHSYMDLGVKLLAYGDDTLITQRAYRDLRRAILKL